MGGSSGQTSQSYSSQSAPWAPTQPLLQGIINQLQGVNTGVTPQQTQALNQIQSNAQGLPNFGPTATGLASNLTSNLPNFNSMQQGNLQQLQSTLSPYTNSNYLNPSTNPYQSQVLNTINQDVQNQVGSMWAGAGLTPNGGEAQAMARGLSQGLAAPLFNQYNQNVAAQQGAAGQLYNAGNATAQNILGNANTGLQTAGQIPGLTNMSPLSSLAASGLGYSLPLSQLGGVEGMTLPIAGLGGQQSGTSMSNTSYNPSPLTMGQQGVGILGSLGNFIWG